MKLKGKLGSGSRKEHGAEELAQTSVSLVQSVSWGVRRKQGDKTKTNTVAAAGSKTLSRCWHKHPFL